MYDFAERCVKQLQFDLEVNFAPGDRCARAALEYSNHPRIVAKIEGGLPDHTLTFLSSRFLNEHAITMANGKEIHRLYQAW